MKIRNYETALKYLEGFIGKVIFRVDKEFLKKHDPLERMRILLSLLGNPQDKFRSILVGGTSGKGSTAYLISHILTIAGYKTGLTISPHLQKVNERLQINNKPISDERFVELLKSLILSSIRQMSKMSVGEPSYFEILVAMAFAYFARERVDIAVVEVGMGGEFDATNTLRPLIAVLTNVSLDHTNVLGKTVEKIVRTKAGIIKKNIVVTGVKQPTVIKIVKDRCKKVGAELNLLWRDFGYKIKKENASGIDFDFISHEENLEDLKLSLLGQYQAENASLAIKAILELKKFGFKISDEAIRKALKTAFFPGRFEIVQGPVKNKFQISRLAAKRANFKFQIALDGAHNPIKMKEFLKNLKKLFPKEKKIFVVGFKFDKDIKKMLKEILRVADEIIITEFKAKTDTNLHASANAVDIKNQILEVKSETKVTVEKDSGKALEKGVKTIQQYNNSAIIIVTGSLYLVGEIRNELW